MPLDAISLRAVVEELRPQLLNLRIDKVQQPERDMLLISLVHPAHTVGYPPLGVDEDQI